MLLTARHCFGAHLSIAGGMHRALEAAHRLRCDTVQVFVKNQRQWQAVPLGPDDVARWHALRHRPGFGPLLAHATYLINLAAADRTLQARSRRALAEELRRCDVLAIPHLILHPGAAGSSRRGTAITRVARALNHVFNNLPELQAGVLLETTAGQGTSLGSTFDELGEIIAQVEQSCRVGVCIDTCHVFAAGYDIRDSGNYESMIDEVEHTVGIARVRCWHLNDSRGACGSRRDRHEHIGRGRLGTAAFRNVLADPRFGGVPMILETPKGTDLAGRDYDAVNLRRLRDIARRLRRRSVRHVSV